MKKTIHNFFFIVLIILSTNINAQELSFFGKFEPGTLIIAKGDPVTSASINDQELKVGKEGLFCFGFDAAEKGSHILKIKFNRAQKSISFCVLDKNES